MSGYGIHRVEQLKCSAKLQYCCSYWHSAHWIVFRARFFRSSSFFFFFFLCSFIVDSNDFHHLFRKWMSCFKLLLLVQCARYLFLRSIFWVDGRWNRMHATIVDGTCTKTTRRKSIQNKRLCVLGKLFKIKSLTLKCFSWSTEFSIRNFVNVRYLICFDDNFIHLRFGVFSILLLLLLLSRQYITQMQSARYTNLKQMYSIHWK